MRRIIVTHYASYIQSFCYAPVFFIRAMIETNYPFQSYHKLQVTCQRYNAIVIIVLTFFKEILYRYTTSLKR